MKPLLVTVAGLFVAAALGASIAAIWVSHGSPSLKLGLTAACLLVLAAIVGIIAEDLK